MPQTALRILYFTDGPVSPGSRFRCLQFFRHLASHGLECDVRFAYDERYNDIFDRPWASLYKISSRLRRVGHLICDQGYDALFLHKTAFAFSPLPEWVRSFGKTPIVFDFDDAIYLGQGGADSRLREQTFRGVLKASDFVIAGNEHLAQVAGVPEKTTVIPSVVDTDLYVPRSHGPGRELVVGWIGTASNFPFLRPVIPQVLSALEKLPRARLRIVSNGLLPEYERHPLVEQWRWSETQELAALQSFDIGLMPLLDTAQTQGKCGFKMIQYMATGTPVIASAVGANIDIFAGSAAGRLVEAGGDWAGPVLELGQDEALRRRLGAAGRAHADLRYSVKSVLPKYLEIFAAAANLRRKAA